MWAITMKFINFRPPKQKKALPFDRDFHQTEHAYFFSLIAACAAARRAIGTRKGEQET